MMDSGLGMVQTSNGVMNNSLLELVKPQSLLAWQRVRVASAGACLYPGAETTADGRERRCESTEEGDA